MNRKQPSSSRSSDEPRQDGKISIKANQKKSDDHKCGEDNSYEDNFKICPKCLQFKFKHTNKRIIKGSSGSYLYLFNVELPKQIFNVVRGAEVKLFPTKAIGEKLETYFVKFKTPFEKMNTRKTPIEIEFSE